MMGAHVLVGWHAGVGFPRLMCIGIEVCLQLLNGFDKPDMCIDMCQKERTDAIKYCSEIWRKP